MKKNVEQVITDSINKLAKNNPKLAEKIIDDGTFISSIYLEMDYHIPGTNTTNKAGSYLIIDFTLKAKDISYKNYQAHTTALLYSFFSIERWYEC